jgi:hypothetical protein
MVLSMYHDFLLLYRRSVRVLVSNTVFSPEHISSLSGYRPPRRGKSVTTLGVSGLQRRLDCCATRLHLGAALGAFDQKRFKPAFAAFNLGTSACSLTSTPIFRTSKNASPSGCLCILRDHGDTPTNEALHRRPRNDERTKNRARLPIFKNLLISIPRRLRAERDIEGRT